MEKLNWTLLVVSLCVLLWGVAGQYEWQIRDAFDEIRGKLDKVNAENCYIAHLDDLFLPKDSVSHYPDVKEINVNPVFTNRTAMLHLHNMAMNRAFFWSYILQSRFIKPAIDDTYDPGMMYYFLSSVADVAANPYINASSIYFSPKMSYTSSYRGFFNKTLPRFAPRALRVDYFNDPVHLQNISTLNTFYAEDLGAFDPDSLSKDYTSDLYRTNEWYKLLLPDQVEKRYDTKTTYKVEIRYANNTNETFTFHGPPGNDEIPGPVNWIKPYFDCGRLNKWLVGAVSPVADIYPRHTQFRHIEYPTYTAVVVMEMDYDRIDINQCPTSPGNDKPNRFAGTARCKNETTECEPLHGWGFRRGSYQCRCRPGYRLPSLARRPYLGEIIERATSDEYYNNYDCLQIGWIQRLPVKWEKAHPFIRAIYADRYYEYVNATSGPSSLHKERVNIYEVLNFIKSVRPENCTEYNPSDLELNGDIAYGAEEQFENQAKMAVRLANFISAFLQVSDPKEEFSGTRVADKPLTEDQMLGETLAIVLGDSKVWSAGTYWDRNKFTDRTFFAPFAYKTVLNTRKYNLEDLARINSTKEVYTNQPWFQFLKQRWSTNQDSLEKFYLKMKIRDSELGKYLKWYERYPTSYRAANIKHGHWTRPYYDCEGKLKQWVITYAAPFFGWDNDKVKLEFKGAVAVTMPLMSLDINQCPDNIYVPNAFKGTDKCDRSTSYCVPIQGRGFEAGGYKCECLQGYEYPFEDLTTYYDGQIVEAEFQNIIEDKQTRIDMFKCRLAGASNLHTDPAQVQGAGEGEGSPQTKPETVPKQAKPEEVKVPDKPEEQIKQEANVETHIDVQANVADAVPKEDVVQKTEASTTDAVVLESDNAVSKEEDKPKESGSSENWEQREQELLKKIEELEKVKNERSEDGLKLELKVREEEIDLLKARVKNLETELQAALSKPGGKNQELIDKIKLQHEELLSKARGMIFDKTKMVKNQELQIEALTTQVQSLKDINQITKDLLEIRNSEVKAMEERFQAMESRFKGEKERYDLVLKRAQTSTNINDDLRKEYETQLAIFKELREKYELRVQALVAENNRLKESMQGGPAPSSTG